MSIKSRSINLRTSHPPKPLDKANEMQVLDDLLNALEANHADARLSAIELFWPITPWIAFKLGNIAKEGAYENKPKIRSKLMGLIVEAAYSSNSRTLILSNLVIFANFLETEGLMQEATSIYNHVLSSKSREGEDTGAAAHLALLLSSEVPAEDVTFHYEMLIKMRGKLLSSDLQIYLCSEMMKRTTITGEVVREVHARVINGVNNFKYFICEILEKLSLEETINFSTKLSKLGHPDLAKQVRIKWKQNYEGAQ